jgi:hypothetical protein
MQKVDLDSMSIDELAKLCDQASEKLAEKIAARQRELATEMEKLAALGKKTKVVAPKKDMKDIKEALKPEAVKPQDISKPQDAAKPQVTKAA